MKILWISNIIFPQLCRELGMPIPFVGGWMESAAMNVMKHDDSIQLGVVSFAHISELRIVDKLAIKHYLVPANKYKDGRYDESHESFFRQIDRDFHPDIVHIHGTEYPHSLAWVKACGSGNVVVSIQGLVWVYAHHYYGGIRIKDLIRHLTLRDLVRNDSIFHQKRRMKRRGECEIELLRSVSHVVGRTSWDKSCAWAVNSDSSYHFCNETLRASFYTDKWCLDSCERHSIFLSQGHYPIKGFHKMIEALPNILRIYPDTKVYIAGSNFMASSIWRRNGYASYVRQLLKCNHVTDKIHFLGPLSEQEMKEQYLKSHVFVCPSAIENSPNSVGEAQLLGVPVVASYVGGTMDMVQDGVTGFLYRFEETSLLAYRVCQLFADDNLCTRLSEQERQVASKRHDADVNAESLISIYKTIQ